MISVGWGTRIRTLTSGVRVRCSTVKLSPTRPARMRWRGPKHRAWRVVRASSLARGIYQGPSRAASRLAFWRGSARAIHWAPTARLARMLAGAIRGGDTIEPPVPTSRSGCRSSLERASGRVVPPKRWLPRRGEDGAKARRPKRARPADSGKIPTRGSSMARGTRALRLMELVWGV